MLWQADEHFKVVVLVFHIAEYQMRVCQLRLSPCRVRHSDTMPSYGRAAEVRTLPKLCHRPKSLKVFTFRAILFHVVW